MKELAFFFDLVYYGTKSGSFLFFGAEFSKARLTEHLSGDAGNDTCYNLLMKLIEKGVLKKTEVKYDKQAKKQVQHYKIDEDRLFEVINTLRKQDKWYSKAERHFEEIRKFK